MAVITHRNLNDSVARAEQPVRGERGVVVATRAARVIRDGLRRALIHVGSHRCCQQRCSYGRSDTGALAVVERGHDSECAVKPGENVGNRNPHSLRVGRAGACHRHEPRFTLSDLVVSGAIGFGSVVPEARDRKHNQSRVERTQPVLTEPQTLHGSG